MALALRLTLNLLARTLGGSGPPAPTTAIALAGSTTDFIALAGQTTDVLLQAGT